MEESTLRRLEDTVLKTIESSLKAQLKAVEKLRKGEAVDEARRPGRPPVKGRSQTDLAYEVLLKEGRAMHVDAIVEAVRQRHGRQLIRDSLVSAITKKIASGEAFEKTARNTFKAR
jgi:hypothetical protein